MQAFSSFFPLAFFWFAVFMISWAIKMWSQIIKAATHLREKENGRSKRMTENDTDNNSATTRITYHSKHRILWKACGLKYYWLTQSNCHCMYYMSILNCHLCLYPLSKCDWSYSTMCQGQSAVTHTAVCSSLRHRYRCWCSFCSVCWHVCFLACAHTSIKSNEASDVAC